MHASTTIYTGVGYQKMKVDVTSLFASITDTGQTVTGGWFKVMGDTSEQITHSDDVTAIAAVEVPADLSPQLYSEDVTSATGVVTTHTYLTFWADFCRGTHRVSVGAIFGALDHRVSAPSAIIIKASDGLYAMA